MPNVSRAFGGPTESLIGYAQAAQSQGIDVAVAAPAVFADDERWLRDQCPGVTFNLFPSAGRHAWIVAPGLWTWLWKRCVRYDVVHVHGLFNPVSSLAAHISTARGRPTVVRPFGTLSRYTFSRRSWLKRIYFHLLDRPALLKATGIHFTTKAERDEARRLTLYLAGRAYVVPPPWRGEASDVDGEVRSERPTVLFMSRLHPKKNVTGLLRAWRHVAKACPSAQLWIAGDGDSNYVQMLRDLVARNDLGHSVSFLGFVRGKEKQRVLREAWVFALPSHQENFGVAVLEAIVAGLPVVISGEVQLRAFVEEHSLGLVVDRTRPPAIAEGILELLRTPSERIRIAEEGPASVRKVFSMSRVGYQLRKMYEQVAEI